MSIIAATYPAIDPARLRRSNLWAVSILAGLNGLDILTTMLCLRAGGAEGNLLARFLLEHGLMWPLKAWLTVSTVILVVAGDTITLWWAENRPEWVVTFKDWWERVRPSWLPRTPDLSPFAIHNLAWFVCGIYALVVTLNTLTYVSLTT